MKVLFVSSGNFKQYGDSNLGIVPIIKAQGDSLLNEGLDLQYFTIVGKGLVGYLSNIFRLRKMIHDFNPDVIHCHYYLTGIIAAISFSRKPIVTSLMGSELYTNSLQTQVIRLFSKFIWKGTIVKSKRMKSKLNMNCSIIPNGVNPNVFKQTESIKSRIKLGLDPIKKYILFISNHNQSVKNYPLALSAASLLDSSEYELLLLSKMPQSTISEYLNAGNVLLLTSFQEGSPNVVKEAVFTNLPVVSTDVGDVRDVIEDIKGCYICEYDNNDIAKKIVESIGIGRTNGRELSKHLKSDIIAKKIVLIYHKVLE